MPDEVAPAPMSKTAFASTVEGEARLLLLIDAFSRGEGTLQGRTKLAKLDFLLRYPRFFRRAMEIRRVSAELPEPDPTENNIEQRMVRFRYGPWDPAYYSLLGSLVGRGLITAIPTRRYVGFRTTDSGRTVAAELARSDAWAEVSVRANLLRSTFRTQQGTFLKDWIYQHFPEVTQASWGERL
jgi:hypothetical protein